MLPISLVAHTAFCPRRAWLESQGETLPSLNIEAGVAAHEKVDRRFDERATQRRSVDIVSERLGITGRCDVVEEDADGRLRVVEFKSAPQRRSYAVTRAQTLQLALQGECLREQGWELSGYAVYFTTSRRMVDVTITPSDVAAAEALVCETRQIVESKSAPPALEQDPRCDRCSHSSICLPDERKESTLSKRVLVRDREGSVLHLNTPGSRAYLRAGRVTVVKGDEKLAELPLERVDSVVVHGNVDLSSALIRELLWRKCPVLWASNRGALVGYATSTKSPNGGPRVTQHVRAAQGDMLLARELIAPKIANQATLMRRFSRNDVSAELRRLRVLQQHAAVAASVPKLLGVEGEAAAIYFGAMRSMVRNAPWALEQWPGRVGRGALDPLNVSLNVAYGLLLADITRAVVATGLDPHAGFVHSSSRNKPALSLDLMEQFRPVIADSAIVSALNNGELTECMFTSVLGSARISPEGRKVIISSYERRVTTSFMHPVFGYEVTWRRAMEVQARMLLGVIDGTQDVYRGITVR